MKTYTEEQGLDFKKNKVCSVYGSLVLNPDQKNTDEHKRIINNSIATMSLENEEISKVLAKFDQFEHPDLMYGSAVLVSTVMNKNDDVFLPEEVWSARHTPVHTSYNEEHESRDIIGHITESRSIDKSGEYIDENILKENPGYVPDYLDIEVDFVIYKSIFPEIAKAIAEKAPKNEQFVSMEAIFNTFDYAVFEEDSTANIIKRNEKTAFLTKYLRAYGGSGVYNNKRIGRVLRDLRFTGMGNVKEPANPASRYTKISTLNTYETLEASLNSTEGEKMEKKEDQVLTFKIKAEYEDSLNVLKAEIDTLKSKSLSLENDLQTVKSDKEKLENDLKTANEKLVAEAAKVTASLAELDKLSNEKKSFEEKVSTLSKDLEAKSTELSNIHKAQKIKDRTSQLKSIGFESMPEDEITKMCDVSDEVYTSMISAIESMKKYTKSSVEVVEKTENTEDVRTEALENANVESSKDDLAQDKGDEEIVNQATKTLEIAERLVASVRKNKKTDKKNTK